MTSVFPIDYDRNQEDLYDSLRYLGSGGYGSVDTVILKGDPIRTAYARKQCAGCLIRALDYLHEMCVKHGDIKPANILIKDRVINFTDFGISKVVPQGETTGTESASGGTEHYIAPEARESGSRHGRAADLFSLGCVFLWMGTILIPPPGSRKRFRKFRKQSSSTMNYTENSLSVVQWMWHLWAHWSIVVKPPKRDDEYARFGAGLPDIVFFMLDPNPNWRITARQLVALITDPDLYYFGSVNRLSCHECRVINGYHDSNLPHHSLFKDTGALEYPKSPTQALKVQVAPNWESVKRKWLSHHMWWRD